GFFVGVVVRHRRGGGCAVPVFFAGCEPNDVAWADFFDRSAPALCAAAAGGDDEMLAQWMRVPCGASAGLEGDTGAAHSCRIRRVNQRINPYGSGKILCW